MLKHKAQSASSPARFSGMSTNSLKFKTTKIMKINYNKILSAFLLIMISAVAVSCLEDRGYTDLVDGVGKNNLILSWAGNFGSPNAQVVQVSGAKADFDMAATLSSSEAPKSDYSATVVVNEDVLDDVNADLEPEDQYSLLPDSTYDILESEINFTAGHRDADFTITFYPDKIDKSISYMLPLALTTSNSSIIVSGNLGVAKLAFIGNPYAGQYKSTYTLTRQLDAAGNEAVATFSDVARTLEPVDAKNLFNKYPGFEVFANPTIYHRLSVNANNTVNIQSAAADGAGVAIGPTAGKTSTYDPVTKTFTLYYEYSNASGFYRRFEEVLVKQ